MKTRNRLLLIGMLYSALVMSCMLPGMIPLNPTPEESMPYMEEDPQKLLETLQSGKVNSLEALAPERYTESDLAKPGRLSYTVTISDETPTYLTYGWCAVDEATLQQNFEHIAVTISFNGRELGEDVVHGLTYTSPENMPCLAFGVLMSDWPAGEYQLEAVATFDEEINDGLADYAAGDYAFVYNVTVK